MSSLIISALIGLLIGWASSMFSRTKRSHAQIRKISAATLGSLIFSGLFYLLGIQAPVMAVAIMGALLALIILIIFSKPTNEERRYYL